MTFVVGLVLAAIASFVTYASVMGVGSMFASTAGPVMVAWTAVEVGKYAAMSYTYRNYKDMSDQLKIAMGAFIVFIMVLTSIGVYAYLGQSYSQVTTSVSKNEVAVKSIAGQLGQTKDRLAAIDRQVAEIPNTATAARIRLIKQYDEERKPLADRQTALEAELAKLTTGTIEAETHVGIIKFLADSFGVSVERATMLAILAVTLCLDPFAMLLNVLFQRLMLQNAENRADYQRRVAAGEFKRRTPPPPTWWKNSKWSDEEIRDRKIAANTNPPPDYARPPMPMGTEEYIKHDNTDLRELLAEAIEATTDRGVAAIVYTANGLIEMGDEDRQRIMDALQEVMGTPPDERASMAHGIPITDMLFPGEAVNSKIKPQFIEKQ